MIDLAFGSHLTSLSLLDLRVPLVPALARILHLAPNLEVIRIIGHLEDAEPPEDMIPSPPATGSRLQVLQLDSAICRGDDFACAVELVRRYSPQAILDGRIVKLKGYLMGDACIAMMELERFNDVESIISNPSSSEFMIQYPAWTLPTQRPVGSRALAELEQHPGGIDLVTRGFRARYDEFRRPNSLVVNILRRSITMTRSLKVHAETPSKTIELFAILAHDVWPTLEHISLELRLDLSDMADPGTWNIPSIHVPRLRDVDIALYQPQWHKTTNPVPEVIQSHADPCVMLINAFSHPNATRFTLRTLKDDAGVASVLAAILAYI